MEENQQPGTPMPAQSPQQNPQQDVYSAGNQGQTPQPQTAEAPQQEEPQRSNGGGKFLSGLIGFIVGALLAGGGVYYWQSTQEQGKIDQAKEEAKEVYEQEISDLNNKVDELETQLGDANNELEEAKKQIEILEKQIEDAGEKPNTGVPRDSADSDSEPAGEMGGSAPKKDDESADAADAADSDKEAELDEEADSNE